AQAKGDVQSLIALQSATNFNGGGHVNHSLFWENLAPKNAGGGAPPEGALAQAINAKYGSYEKMIEKFNAALAGIQGSGWAWLVKDKATGDIGIKTYAVCLLHHYGTRKKQIANNTPEPRSRRRPICSSLGY
ncbi:Superoxide dismutase [Mn], mitochondrial, partial [Ascosphaera atra]